MGRLLLVALMLLVLGAAAQAQRSYDVDILSETFGFDDNSRRSVDLVQLIQACPARDCIPSIDNPKYVSADEALHVNDDDLVITLSYNGEYFAFPTRILDRHEIVNGTFAGDALAITWCPLCGSAVGIERHVGNSETTFGVSGLLYNSDLVLYDRATETLWDQIEAKGVVGPMTGTELTLVPLSIARWSKWRAKHPDTLVLSSDTGFDIDYSQDRYAGYRESSRLFMPVSATDDRVHAKTVVFGFDLDFAELAITEASLLANGRHRLDVAGKPSVITLHEDGSVTLDRDGEVFHPIRLFWFAWYTFHPETELVQSE